MRRKWRRRPVAPIVLQLKMTAGGRRRVCGGNEDPRPAPREYGAAGTVTPTPEATRAAEALLLNVCLMWGIAIVVVRALIALWIRGTDDQPNIRRESDAQLTRAGSSRSWLSLLHPVVIGGGLHLVSIAAGVAPSCQRSSG